MKEGNKERLRRTLVDKSLSSFIQSEPVMRKTQSIAKVMSPVSRFTSILGQPGPKPCIYVFLCSRKELSAETSPDPLTVSWEESVC